MKKLIAALFAVCFSGVGLAQQTKQQPEFGVACMTGPGQQGCPVPDTPRTCPVSMEAKHLADGSLVQTSSAHPKGIGQWLSLSLNNAASDEKQIATATFVVHGVKPTGHVTQALSLANGPDTATQTVTVPVWVKPHQAAPANSWAGQEAHANLWVPGMSAVDRIQLQALAYTDGSSWKAADGQACSVIPDPKMLITSR